MIEKFQRFPSRSGQDIAELQKNALLQDYSPAESRLQCHIGPAFPLQPSRENMPNSRTPLAPFQSGVFGASLFLLLCPPAFAHDGFHGTGFGAGFLHPLTGLDHLLAMLAVGIWAAQSRRAAAWVLPVLFPVMMVAGAGAAFAGMRFPAVESGIAASVLILGLFIAFAVRMPLWTASVFVSVFALLHGWAHGNELPANASALVYGAGFVLATALLHAAGLAFGSLFAKQAAQKAIRIAGGMFAAAGLFMLVRLA
jgi:urease accessory protein